MITRPTAAFLPSLALASLVIPVAAEESMDKMWGERSTKSGVETSERAALFRDGNYGKNDDGSDASFDRYFRENLRNHDGLWETCDTTNDSWSYAWYDQNWKDSREILRRVVSTVGRGGTYLLNVGPDGKGRIPAKAAGYLVEGDASKASLEGFASFPRVEIREMAGNRRENPQIFREI
jgi:alpha-L-fucosidase